VWVRGRAFFSRADATGLSAACAGGDLTVEAWLSSDNSLLDGPSRVFTFSLSTSERFFTLGQESSRWSLRHVTADTGPNGDTNNLVGKPNTGFDSVAPGTPQHVVFVRESEVFTTYLDGVQVDQRDWPGEVTGVWSDAHGLGAANEFGKDRPWLGGIYLLAAYCRALDSTEVEQNYAAGP
jgi:hypothetical protein